MEPRLSRLHRFVEIVFHGIASIAFLVGPSGCTAGGIFVESKQSIDSKYSNWLSSQDYQVEFDEQVVNGFYPVEVEGRNHNGQSQYRGRFVPVPDNPWESRHGFSGEALNEEKDSLLSLGYEEIWVQSFVDAAGMTRYQATWVRR